MEIKAALVKELRERTGAGMMECKKALVENKGDIEAAIEAMRKSGLAKAAKKAGRIAAEGLITIQPAPDGYGAVMVEVNCETDFVTKGDDFKTFSEQVAQTVLSERPEDVEALSASVIQGGEGGSVEERRQQLVAKIGENVSVRRFAMVESDDVLGRYQHGTRIGVLVDLQGGDEALAKDVAMHIAASRPLCIAEADVPADMLEKEKEILAAQAQQTGKPAAIIDKMVVGRIKKFVAEVTLLGQPFVKDPDTSIAQLLEKAGATVNAFTRFEVGEGLEKRTENFADEVMAQVKGA